MSLFIPVNREQLYLLPPSLQDWLPEDDLAWFLLDALAAMDLRCFYEKTKSRDLSLGGHPAYEPRLLAGVLIYAYCFGERSSRQIERLCQRDMGFRVMAANLAMDHVTLSRFRKTHETAMASLFLEVLKLCAEAGLAKVGTIAVDGTKLKANAALSANKTREGLAKEIEAILAEAARVDAAEDTRYGEEKRGDELPEGMRFREGRLERLKACQARLTEEAEAAKAAQAQKIEERERREEASGEKARGRKPVLPEEKVNEKAKANVTDPESRIVKTREGYAQGYNAQATVNEDQIILAAEVTQDENDVQQGPVMLGRTKDNLAAIERPEAEIGTALLDAGYWSEPAVMAMSSQAREVLTATRKAWKHRQAYREQGAPKGRIPGKLSLRERMERRLRTKRGRALYKRRSQIVEPVFGQIKERQRQDRFSRRGFSACDAEWKLMAACHNLLKLWRKGALPRN